ncbi:hypothetical protein JQN72_00990 [Phycicoccus sp. CSK15P-2]|uniref:hypothetical protein n=1 Tax=Phycicoccus sp. CSK15P-2 TaxID=2807627 RepID=UPI0019526D1B|nr:hypothetical protein [Phycicoccus sp. CSK15P-2]MBM6402820.1 hypothetical protein [Phycicoccus sp. CSK15P-2]
MTGRGDGIRPRPDAAAAYGAMLAEQLRQGGLAEPRVRVVVADLLDHVRTTGEDPVQAFGQPADYARAWVRPLSRWRVLGRAVATAVGAVGMFAAVTAFFRGGSWSARMSVTIGDLVVLAVFALGAGVLPWTLELWLGHRAARRVGRRPRVPDVVIRAGVMLLVLGLLFTVFTAFDPEVWEPVVLGPPRPVVFVVGMVVAAVLSMVRQPRSPALPRLPGTPERWWERTPGRPGRRRR